MILPVEMRWVAGQVHGARFFSPRTTSCLQVETTAFRTLDRVANRRPRNAQYRLSLELAKTGGGSN
jgi:hypothetical protein